MVCYLLTHLLLAEGQLSHLFPFRSLEVLHLHPLFQAHPQGSHLAVGQVSPILGPSFHQLLPGPEAPGRDRESAGANPKDCRCSRLPCARHTARGRHFTSLGLHPLICKMGLQGGLDTVPSGCLDGLSSLLPGLPYPLVAPAVSSYSAVSRVIFFKSQIKPFYSPAKVLQWQPPCLHDNISTPPQACKGPRPTLAGLQPDCRSPGFPRFAVGAFAHAVPSARRALLLSLP